VRTKTVLKERVEKGHPDESLLAATQSKGVVRKDDYEFRTVLALKDLQLLKLVRERDFVVSLRSFQGGIEYARHQGIISPAYTVLYPVDPDTHGYLGWLFKSRPYVENLSLYVTGIRQGQNIDYERLSRSRLPLPPAEDRRAIVRFLNHADQRIRRQVAAKRKLIALLNEQKQAVIHRSVTRGLARDVRLKASGLEWLGDVPEHWGVVRAKVDYTEVDDRSGSGSEELLSVSHLTGVTPRSEKSITMFMAESYAGHKLCRAADLVVNTMWAWMGALGVARQTGLVSPAYGVYRPKRNAGFEPTYLEHLLRTNSYVGEYLRRSTGIQSSRLRLYAEQFLSLPLLKPPRSEQEEIVASIANATREIDRAWTRSQREIDLMREYRTRLIADVVTGRLDVREAAARLPDEIDEPADIGDELFVNGLADFIDVDSGEAQE
jgi:type I restriction enzyme S subunit